VREKKMHISKKILWVSTEVNFALIVADLHGCIQQKKGKKGSS
jgi:hypothetical protein